MRSSASVSIRAPRKLVWDVVRDIEHAGATVKAIERIGILERPAIGSLVGLKWRETRTMFGKSATETMWITAAVEGSHYDTRAQSHGMVYTTHGALADAPDGTRR